MYVNCNLTGEMWSVSPAFAVSTQFINRKLKEIKVVYRLKIDHFSTHSFRKTFGRRIWEQDNHSEKSLIMLSEIFNHSGTVITRKYLGIRQEEIANVYELL
jgi:integrase